MDSGGFKNGTSTYREVNEGGRSQKPRMTRHYTKVISGRNLW